MSDTVKMKLTMFAHTQYGAFSTLQCGESSMVILENPWKDNEVNVSCIPAGIYEVVRIKDGPREGQWWVTNVEGRTEILIHPGNTDDDTQGCLLPGMELGSVKGKWAVLNSGEALARLNAWCEGVDTFTLYIDRTMLGQDYRDNNRV